jgi:hypothetical protein
MLDLFFKVTVWPIAFPYVRELTDIFSGSSTSKIEIRIPSGSNIILANIISSSLAFTPKVCDHAVVGHHLQVLTALVAALGPSSLPRKRSASPLLSGRYPERPEPASASSPASSGSGSSSSSSSRRLGLVNDLRVYYGFKPNTDDPPSLFRGDGGESGSATPAPSSSRAASSAARRSRTSSTMGQFSPVEASHVNPLGSLEPPKSAATASFSFPPPAPPPHMSHLSMDPSAGARYDGGGGYDSGGFPAPRWNNPAPSPMFQELRHPSSAQSAQYHQPSHSHYSSPIQLNSPTVHYSTTAGPEYAQDHVLQAPLYHPAPPAVQHPRELASFQPMANDLSTGSLSGPFSFLAPVHPTTLYEPSRSGMMGYSDPSPQVYTPAAPPRLKTEFPYSPGPHSASTPPHSAHPGYHRVTEPTPLGWDPRP